MNNDYSYRMEWCLSSGERFPYSYEEYNRCKVLEVLKECLKENEWKKEKDYAGEGKAIESILWIMKSEEKIEKGVYRNYSLSFDVAIVASPVLMAILMGEYELAILLCRNGKLFSQMNRVEELYLADGEGIVGGSYSLGEACLLCTDMSSEQLQFFTRLGVLNTCCMLEESSCLYENTYFMQVLGMEEGLWYRPLYIAKELSDMSEDIRELLGLIIQFLIGKRVYKGSVQFWEKLFDNFDSKEERVIMVEAVHRYFCGANNYIFSDVLEKALITYFQYEEALPIVGAIERYIVQHVIKECYRGPHFRDRLEKYFSIVKRFEGMVSNEWKNGMMAFLKQSNEKLLVAGFQSGFLKPECKEEYVDYLLQERLSGGEGYTQTIVRLIQMIWREEALYNK